ncbi:otolin-1-like [Lethenteron reissneri]|uniref:otolin-1-like n=1 Tax=Lethenteron reissneri TaxID=7753 RepID=UPI002AB61D9A|nr:otolin-1-like [Lethenteron reissneri]XP_061412710.1 otolin-1-like [Lethenteron reissneri]
MRTWLSGTLMLLVVSAGTFAEEGEPRCEGQKGYLGIHGKHGKRGSDGQDGADGAKGERGDPGEAVKGNTGLPGMQGPKGQNGLNAPMSENGPQGNKGVQGARGDPGHVGTMGANGDRGPRGHNGNDGAKGSPYMLPRSAFSVKTSYRKKSTVGILKHDLEIANLQKHYNTQTGKFKCEHPGYYYFTFYLSVSGKNLTAFLKRNTRTILTVTDELTKDSGAENMGGSIVQHLDKGDTVWVDIDATNNGIFVDHARDNVFSGFILNFYS